MDKKENFENEMMEIIDMMDEEFDKAMKFPLFGKVIIDKQAMIDYLQNIRLAYPKEIKEARWVHKERERIINEAREKADEMIREAENEIAQILDEHYITREANEKAQQIINNANAEALAIKNECDKFVDDLILDAEKRLEKLLKQAHDDREAFKRNR